MEGFVLDALVGDCRVDVVRLEGCAVRLGEHPLPVVVGGVGQMYGSGVEGLLGFGQGNRVKGLDDGVLVRSLILGLLVQLERDLVVLEHITGDGELIVHIVAVGDIDVMLAFAGVDVRGSGHVRGQLHDLELLGCDVLAVEQEPTVGVAVSIALLLGGGVLPVVTGLGIIGVGGGLGGGHPLLGDDTECGVHAGVSTSAHAVAILVRHFRSVNLHTPDVGADTRILHALGAEGDTIEVGADGLGRNVYATGGGDLFGGDAIMVGIILLGGRVLTDVAILACAPQFGFVLGASRNVALQRDFVGHVHAVEPQRFGALGVHVNHVELFGFVVAAVPDNITIVVGRVGSSARSGGRDGNLHTVVVLVRRPVGRNRERGGFDVLVVVQTIGTHIRMVLVRVFALGEFTNLREVFGIVLLDHLASVRAVLGPDFKLDFGTVRCLGGLAGGVGVSVDGFAVELLIRGLVEHVVDLRGLVLVIAVRVAQPLLGHGGGELLHRGAFVALVTGLVVGTLFTVDMLVEHAALRGLQRGLPVNHASLGGLEAWVSDLESQLARTVAFLTGLDCGELVGVDGDGLLGNLEQALVAVILFGLTVHFHGDGGALRNTTDDAGRIAVALTFVNLTISELGLTGLIVNGDFIVQLFAGRTHLLRVGRDDTTRIHLNGFGRQTQIVGSQLLALRRPQSRNPVHGTGVIGVGGRAGDGELLGRGGFRIGVLDVHAHVVQQLRSIGIRVAGYRVVGGERDVGAFEHLTGDGRLISELLARLDLALGHLGGDGRRTNSDGFFRKSKVVGGKLASLLVVQGCLPIHVSTVHGVDGLGLDGHGLALSGVLRLSRSDVDLLVFQQKAGVRVRLLTDRIVGAEHHEVTRVDDTLDVGGVVEVLSDTDARGGHVRGDGRILDLNGLTANTQIMGGEHSAVGTVQGGLPIHVSAFGGVGLRAGDVDGLSVLACGDILGRNVHTLGVKQFRTLGVRSAVNRSVGVEGDIIAGLDLAVDGGGIGELLVDGNLFLADLGGDGRVLDKNAFAGGTQLVGGEFHSALVVERRLPVDDTGLGGGHVRGINSEALTSAGRCNLVGWNVHTLVVKQFRGIRIRLAGNRVIGGECQIRVSINLVVDDGGVVERTTDIGLLCAGLGGEGRAYHFDGLVLQADGVTRESLSFGIVEFRNPVDLTNLVGADFRGLHLELGGVGMVCLVVGDVHASVVQQLVGGHVRLAGHGVIRGEGDIGATRNQTGDGRGIVELLTLGDGGLVHVGGQCDGLRVLSDEGTFPRIVVRALESFRTVGAGEVLDEHVVAAMGLIRDLDVHIGGNGLGVATIARIENDFTAADLVLAVHGRNLPFANQLVVGILSRLLFGGRNVLLILILVAGAGTGPPDTNLGLRISTETIVRITGELTVIGRQTADVDFIKDVLVHTGLLLQHGGVVVRRQNTHGRFLSLAELIDVIALDVILLGLVCLDFNPNPCSEQSSVLIGHLIIVQTVHTVIVDATGSGLRLDGVGLTALGEAGGRGGNLTDAIGFTQTLQIVGRILTIVLLDDLKDMLGVTDEIVALEFDGHVVRPLVVGGSDTGGHTVFDRGATGQLFLTDAGTDGRLKITRHRELDITRLILRVGRPHHILTGGI